MGVSAVRVLLSVCAVSAVLSVSGCPSAEQQIVRLAVS